MFGVHHIYIFGTFGKRMNAKKHVGARFAEKGSWVVTLLQLLKGGFGIDPFTLNGDKLEAVEI